jgi:copper oxidase (laccase) domain-containing protein
LSLSSATVAFTGRAEGDMGHGGAFVAEVRPDVEARRRAVVDLPWTWLRQVHGATVVRVGAPGGGAGTRADAAVTDRPGCAIAVLTADCAPVALASDEGVIGVAHAGWRGLAAGVIEATVDEMRALGATRIFAAVGPCIRAGCYEFGPAELDEVVCRSS